MIAKHKPKAKADKPEYTVIYHPTIPNMSRPMANKQKVAAKIIAAIESPNMQVVNLSIRPPPVPIAQTESTRIGATDWLDGI